MAKANRECYTCGQRYHHCPTCPSEAKKETFYNMFCSERCSKIFKALTNETFKHITTAECKEQLLQLNVTVDENFKDGVNNHIAKVFNYSEPVAETPKEVDMNIETVSDVEEIIAKEVEVTLVVPEENEVKKMKYVPKKNRKRQNSEVD